MATYEFHPFADVWRLFNDDEFARLKADIAEHGMRLPIVLYQGKILDGRNRYRAAGELGLPIRYEQAKAKNDAEALALVVSLNEHRRHLSEAERAFIAEKLATLELGANQHGNKEGSSKEGPSQEQAAKLMKVSLISVERARAVKKHAPELEAEVKAGRKSLTAAADEARARAAPKPKPAKDADGSTAWKRAQAAREARALRYKPLTREEVDPDFQGTGMEWVAKHGHVQSKTAAERYETDLRIAQMKWLGTVAKMAEGAKELLALRPRPSFRGVAKKRLDRNRDHCKLINEAVLVLEDEADEADPIVARPGEPTQH